MNIQTIGYIVTLLTLIPAASQVRHSLRLYSVAGISGATTCAWVYSWSAWILYGYIINDGPVVLHNIIGLVPAMVFLYVYGRLSRLRLRLYVSIGVVYAIAAIVMVVDESIGLLSLVIMDIIFYTPSVVKILRTKEPRGVSLTATLMYLVLTGSWFTYLLIISTPTAVIGVGVGFASTCITLYKVLAYRRRTDSTIHVSAHQTQQESLSIVNMLRDLANHTNVEVRRAVALHPLAPVSLLRELAQDDDAYVRGDVAQNPSTPTDILTDLAREAEVLGRWYVAQNPATPVEVLRALAQDENELIRWDISLNPSTPIDMLQELSRDKHPYVRRGVAGNPSTPVDILTMLANDEDWDVRRVVSENPSNPVERIKLIPDGLREAVKHRNSVLSAYVRNTRSRR